MTNEYTNRIDAWTGVANMLHLLSSLGQEAEHREDVFTDEFDEFIVDTCKAPDTSTWETGVQRDGDWVIVQQYRNRDEAASGHNKWVTKLKAAPDMKLKDVDVWGLGI